MLETKFISMLGGEELILLRLEATDRNVILPTEATTKRYGITLKSWILKLESQGWVCPICCARSKTGAYVTDHQHVRGWKKLPDTERAKTFRGCLCNYCNHRVLRALTLTQAQRCAKYLEDHEKGANV